MARDHKSYYATIRRSVSRGFKLLSLICVILLIAQLTTAFAENVEEVPAVSTAEVVEPVSDTKIADVPTPEENEAEIPENISNECEAEGSAASEGAENSGEMTAPDTIDPSTAPDLAVEVPDNETDQQVTASECVTYKINYVLNGGMLAEGTPDTYIAGSAAETAVPFKTGYTFAGWYTNKKLKKAFAGITAELSGDITLYAKWTANTYRVVFNGNGTGDGNCIVQNFTYGKRQKLVANKFKLSGYTFKGWNTQPDGSGIAYANKQRVQDLTGESNVDVILYAQWTPIAYKISYKMNGGVNAPENPSSYTVFDAVHLTDPTRGAYAFVGWYRDRKFTVPFTGLDAGNSGDLTLYARWRAKTYNFVFHGNGAWNTEDYVQTIASDVKKPYLTANRFSLDRYTFVNWNTEPDGTGYAYSDKQNVGAFQYEDGATIDLYAQWRYNMTTMNYRGTEFVIINTALPVEYFAAYTEANGICQTAGTDHNVYSGRCQAFAKYYCGCLIKGNYNINVKDGRKGNRLGVGFTSKKEQSPAEYHEHALSASEHRQSADPDGRGADTWRTSFRRRCRL